MATGLDRFMQQLEKACDELDGKNPDHDVIKERIAAAMAAAAIRRVQIMDEAIRAKAAKQLEKK